jgi:uncharacterized lipoprotein NlpE involved in copper resistance
MIRFPAAAMLRGGRMFLLALGLAALPGLALADTPREALHWAGPYQGLLPCADCAGIVTLLELSPDGTYRLQEIYAGRSDNPVDHSGSFTWDEAGAVISLDGFDPPRRYKVGTGQLWALDLAGRVIEGGLAAAYILTKAD